MMPRILFLQIVFIFSFSQSYSQVEWCGTPDPPSSEKYLQYQSDLKDHIGELERIEGGDDQLISIPVVVHVFETDQLQNISVLEIQNAIDDINSIFDGSLINDNPTNIEFCLANQDPNGEGTNGINFIDCELPNCGYYSETEVFDVSNHSPKSSSSWPHHYFNIWIVNEISTANGGNAFGFSTFQILSFLSIKV